MRKHLLTILLLITSVVFLYAGWVEIEEVPCEVNDGGCIVYGDGYIWCVVGGGDGSFCAYDITYEEWEDSEDVPVEIDEAAAITFESILNHRVFVVTVDNLWIFKREGPDSYYGEWEENPISLPTNGGPGVSLTFQPLQDENGYYLGGWLYLLLGGGSQSFYRCFVSDTAVGTRQSAFEWQELQPIPVEVNAGGALCYHKHSEQESLYAFVGNGDTRFYCYSISSNTWMSRDGSPLYQNDGSSIVSGYRSSSYQYRNKLYAIFGESQEREYDRVYDIADDDWDTGDRLPALLGSGASIAYDPRYDDAYLTIGGNKDNFYVSRYPGAVQEEEGPQSQKNIPLSQKSRISNYQDKVIIHYSTITPSRVKIQIYDLSGKQVKSLLKDNVQNGEHQVTWFKTDNSNKKVSSGVYIITINKENLTERLKVYIK